MLIFYIEIWWRLFYAEAIHSTDELIMGSRLGKFQFNLVIALGKTLYVNIGAQCILNRFSQEAERWVYVFLRVNYAHTHTHTHSSGI